MQESSSQQTPSTVRKETSIVERKVLAPSFRFSDLGDAVRLGLRWVRESFTPALSQEEKDRMKGAREEIRHYFQTKLKKYGIQSETLKYHPRVRYKKSDGSGMGGYYQIGVVPQPLSIFVNKKGQDLLDVANILSHEYSHYYTYQNVRGFNFIAQIGLETGPLGQSDKGTGQALENGFAIMDEVDLYSIVTRFFPEEAKKRDNVIGIIKGQVLESLEQKVGKLYLPINLSTLPPFIAIPLGETNIENNALGYLSYKNFRFAQEICHTVGYVLLKNEGKENTSVDEQIAKGRAHLEQDRYTGKNEARDMMQAIFGKSTYDLIMKTRECFRPEDEELMDEAMSAVRQKQAELGIY